jgi:hypothetical protein
MSSKLEGTLILPPILMIISFLINFPNNYLTPFLLPINMDMKKANELLPFYVHDIL